MNTKYLAPFLIRIVTVLVYVLAKFPLTSPYSLHISLMWLVGLVVYYFFLKTRQPTPEQKSIFTYMGIVMIMLLVATTGWFVSPFFFLLYLLATALSFMFTPAVSIAFVVTLITLFSLSIGEIDLAYDFLVVLSFLTVIPLSYFLRKRYLQLKQSEKQILVLKEEYKEAQTKVESLLANVINKFAVEMRQPLSDIKLIAHHISGAKSVEAAQKDSEKIKALIEEALESLNDFEAKATGNKLLSTPKDNP